MFGRGALLIVLVVCATTMVSASSPLWGRRVNDVISDAETLPTDETARSYRLPNNTRPISYNVHLTTHVHTNTNFNFSGVVSIRFRVINVSNTITLHHRQLVIGAASLALVTNPNTPILMNPPQYDSTVEFLTFSLRTGNNLIVDREYILTINYNGILREEVAGFYRSDYRATDGSVRWLATTHFEQTDARHAFPCYDEPALRALFTINITHGSNYHAISNMPIVSKTNASAVGYTTTSFAVTAAPVPTYLIAFVVSDFESKSRSNAQGFVQQVFARPNAIQTSDFALDVGLKSLDAFGEYFGIPFTFPKMDQVAIPDFPIGAMENWGLVTYIEHNLLYNASESTFVNRRTIATIIVHEFTHQWFGNLVTPKWWTYNWMKEGFATLYETVGTHWLYPDWELLDAFVFSFTQTVMVSDGTSATRPMTHYVESPLELSRQFDSIAYSKSGCVLNMFMHAFTETSFKKGLIGYLNLKKNTDGVEEELFSELEKAVKADRTLDAIYDVPTIFASWTRQAGYPVVVVERNYGNGEITLEQERYLAANESTTSSSIWWIPYNIATGSDADFSLTAATSWFSNRSATIRHGALASGDWLLLNKQMTGYYRVKYDLRNYKLLSEALVENHRQIHLTSRSQLIDDAFDLARTQRSSYDVALDFIKYLEHEVEYVPWASAFRGLEYVDRLYAGNANYRSFANYLVNQMVLLYNDTGLVAQPTERHYRKQARNQVVQWSCRLGSEQCLNETSIAVNDYLTRSVAIHQDHRATILCNGIRSASAAQYNQLIGKLQAEVNQLERNRFINALACVSNVDLIKQYLAATVSADTLYLSSTAERYRAFFEVAGINQNSTKIALEFLKTNLVMANTRYGSLNTNAAILRLANFVVSDERSNEFDGLLAEAGLHTFIDAGTIASARSIVATNKRWIDRNERDINEWIKTTNGSAHVMVSMVLMIVIALSL